ncbi:MAG: hypothetical protein M3Y17_11850 [Actinomycetota bacterium]|nr:hypothetical protein [Actinomycetota bacterium]
MGPIGIAGRIAPPAGEFSIATLASEAWSCKHIRAHRRRRDAIARQTAALERSRHEVKYAITGGRAPELPCWSGARLSYALAPAGVAAVPGSGGSLGPPARREMLQAMFDEHLNRQHRLSYFVRGPEWAFAIPQGDVDALEDVMRRCSTFWNGVGSLLVPVRADGRISNPELLDLLLTTRPVDACYMHEALTDAARTTVHERVAPAMTLWDGFDQREAHPLNLRENPAIAQQPGLETRLKPRLEVPVFRSAALRRAALALWGHISDEDRPHWQDRYQLVIQEGEAAHGALLRGQLDGAGAAPLRLTARFMGRISSNVLDWPHVWVLSGSTFNELVNMWNFRARMTPAFINGAPVAGIPRESLRRPRQLQALTQWLPRVPGTQRNPDTYVASMADLDDEVRPAMTALGFQEETGDQNGETFGRGAIPNDPPTFSFMQPVLGGPFIRGMSATSLVAFTEGRSSLALQAPENFRLRSFAQARLTFQNLPMPLPVTPLAARRVHPQATARDGVMLLTNARAAWDFDVKLPTASEALTDWVSDHGYRLGRSSDGLDAEALLLRLGSLDRLDALANRRRFELLRVLAPPTRKKLAQHLVGQATRAGARLDENEMLERLAAVGLFLEVEARTAGEIASAMEMKKAEVFGLLAPLVEAGFVHRAYRIRCPQCRFWQLLELSAQSEHVRCRACGENFLMPVVDTSGAREPERHYQLDGLMARAMDQDVLPMLLALRALRPPPEQGQPFYAWPGVEVAAGDDDTSPVEIDLVISVGQVVWCFETKQTAGSLKAPQLHRQMKLAAALGARPGIAAVDGTFPSRLAEEVKEAGGRVLTGEDLLT